MQTHKAVTLTAFGGYEEIKLKEVPYPQPDAHQVLVKIEACGMNFSDIYNRQGIFTFRNIQPPFVMGAEAAGMVVRLGEDVAELKIGDRVMCWNFTYGMWAQFATVPVNQCFLMPDEMTYHEAASIPINYVTAYQAIKGFGGLTAGQSVLIQSAGGGVGWAATQISRSEKNVTIFGTASAGKHELIKANGVTHPINYRDLDFVEEVLRVSPEGVNIVLDCLSGNDFMRSQELLKHMGRIIHIGISNMITGEKKDLLQTLKVWWQMKDISLKNLIERNQSVCGLNIATLQEQDPKAFQAALHEVLKLYKKGVVKPRIDSIWTFDQVREASDHMLNRKNIGKVILVPDHV